MKTAANSGVVLVRRARELATQGDPAGASELLMQAATAYSGAGDTAKTIWALGSAGYLLFVSGHPDRGLLLLKQAAAGGYDDPEKVDDLAQRNIGGRPAVEHPGYIRVRARVHRNARTLVAEEWLSQRIDPWRWMTFCRPRDLTRLRVRVPGRESGGELADLHHCLSWVHEQFGHDPECKASRPDPITILREARAGGRFACQEYALLLSATLQCHGHPARVIAALRDNYHRGTGKGHWLVEAWCTTLGKWIVMDAQNNCVWKHGQTLLSGAELSHAVATGKTAGIAPTVAGKRTPRLIPWLEHFRHLWIYRNQDYFSGWDPLGPAVELGGQPQLLFQGRGRSFVASSAVPDGLYPAMHKVSFEARVERTSLAFILEHSFPFFSHYEMSINGESWSRCTARPRVPLRKGRTQVRFRVIGASGASCEDVGVTVLQGRAVADHVARTV